MAKCFPDFIPADFADVQSLADAYRMGWNHGHGLACHNVPELGTTIWCDALGRVTVTLENIKEVHEAFCFQAESNSRDFSPFEFIAHDFNVSEDADELWTAFDAGVAGAIFTDVSEYTPQDYGIDAA